MLNAALLLTYFRMALVIPLVVLSYMDSFPCRVALFVVFVLASLTDTFDGWVARKFNLVTNLGKFLDPVADKILVFSMLLVIVDIEPRVPAWILVIIVARDFIVGSIRSVAASEGVILTPTQFAKFKTSTQFVFIGTILLIWLFKAGLRQNIFSLGANIPAWVLDYTPAVLIFLMAVLVVLSSFSYIKKFWRIIHGYGV